MTSAARWAWRLVSWVVTPLLSVAVSLAHMKASWRLRRYSAWVAFIAFYIVPGRASAKNECNPYRVVLLDYYGRTFTANDVRVVEAEISEETSQSQPKTLSPDQLPPLFKVR